MIDKKINVLVDHSSFVYRAFYATSWATTIDPSVKLFTNWMERILDSYSEFTDVAFYSVIDKNNRKSENFDKLDSYKDGRSTPDLLKQNFDEFTDKADELGFKVIGVDGQEADDVIASIVSQTDRDYSFVFTGDKDLLQLAEDGVCSVYLVRSSKQGTQFVKHNSDRVCEMFQIDDPKKLADLKAFIGDGSDNYPGVKYIGMKTAQGLLKQFGDFDGIYSALDAGQIGGAKARHLSEGREIGKICLELATLNRSLDLGKDIID